MNLPPDIRKAVDGLGVFQGHLTTVLLSGGMDSATLVGLLKYLDLPVRAISISYGQRHRRELDAAVKITQHYNIEHELLTMDEFGHVAKGSSQTDVTVPVPEGHYTDESMRVTVVPNRNMYLLAIAAASAVSNRGTKDPCVGYAAHAGDHAIYPDCRPEFAAAMARALWLCNEPPVRLYAPFLARTKRQVAEFGKQLHVPYELTYSCYNGGEAHCGKCGTCVERREALEGFDPTTYA